MIRNSTEAGSAGNCKAESYKTQGRAPLRFFVSAALCALCLSLPHAVQAQSANDLQGRIARLENELQTLNRAVFKGEMPPPGQAPSATSGAGVAEGQAAALQVRLSQMETELRSLTGRLEEQQFEIRRLQAIVDERLATSPLQGYGQAYVAGQQPGGQAPAGSVSGSPSGFVPLASPSGAAEASPVQTAPDPAFQAPTPAESQQLGSLSQNPVTGAYQTPAGGATEIYENAFSLLKDQNYDMARQAFEDFLTRYPDHSLAGNAKYWLGETYYVDNNYEQAARVFAEAYDRFPQGSKGPDSLLKLGMSLSGMGKNQEACLAYKQLKTQYSSAGSVISRAEREIERIGCGA